jgi:hypothetical protein
MKHNGLSLRLTVESSGSLREVRNIDVLPGDYLVVRTLNSTYTMRVLPNGYFQICGGWFDKEGLSPFITTIAGSTWGGSIIKIDSLAARGLRIEFGNRVLTSPVQTIVIIREFNLN